MPRHHATDTDRIAAQREYKRAWYQRNQAREQQKARDRYTEKYGGAIVERPAESVELGELDELIDAICNAV